MNPRRLTPSMSLLLAFEASARHLSFTRAAAELLLTQSAVSRQVQALETLLDVSLFLREARKIVLTDAGAMYQREVGAALQRIRSASLQAISHRSGEGSLHLAALPTFAAKWLMPRLNDFYQRHPGVLVHIHSRIGQFDVALAGVDAVIGVGDGKWPGMVAHHLVDEFVVPVIGARLATESPVRTPQDLTKHLLLQVAGRPETWHRWFTAHRLPAQALRPGPQFELTSHLIQAVSSGIGVGLLPDFLVEDDLKRGVLQTALEGSFRTGAAYYLFVPTEKAQSPPVLAFRDWLMSVKDFGPREPGRHDALRQPPPPGSV